jgi:NAD(P)H-flavin reductase
MRTFSFVNILSQPEEGWAGERGKLDEFLLRKHVTDFGQSVFWISGPPPMVSAYGELIEQMGVSEDLIRTDRFIGY